MNTYQYSDEGSGKRLVVSTSKLLRRLNQANSLLSGGKIAGAFVTLAFLCSFIMPQTALSQDENGPPICTLSNPGMIDGDGVFSEDPGGIDYEIKCAGTLESNLNEESIMTLLESTERFEEGKSKITLDITDVDNDDYSIYFVSDAGWTVLKGELTNGNSLEDYSAVGFNGENPVENEGMVYDINVENRAKIAVKGDGRRGLGVFHEHNGGGVNVINYGMITTEGDGYVRNSNSYKRANGIQASSDVGNGNVVVSNRAGSKVHVTGSGARGISAYHDGTGNTEIHNYGTVITQGVLWDVPDSDKEYAPRAIDAGAKHGNATAINYKGGSITTGVEDDSTSGTEARGIHAATGDYNVYESGNAKAENHGTILTYGDEARGVHSSTFAFITGTAISSNTGTITTHGVRSHGLVANSHGTNAGDASADNTGTIVTHGHNASGVGAWGNDHVRPDSRISASNSGSGSVTTESYGAEGVSAFYIVYSAIGTNAPGTATATNSNGGTITTKGDEAYGLQAGFWANTNPEWGAIGGSILNSGDAIVENHGTVVASGEGSRGLNAITYGNGDIKITSTGSITAGTQADASAQPAVEGKFGIGIWGGAYTDTTADDLNSDVDVMIVVSGSKSSIKAYGDATQNGIAILAGSGPKSGHAEVTISDGASVSAFGKDGGYAVLFNPGRGTLNLSDSTIVGNISFADGDHEDELNINGSNTTSITGNIMGLEMLNKNGTGAVRFNGDVNAEGSTLNLNEGSLIIAGTLDLKDGTLTIKQAGKLVFEINSATEHGSLSADLLHFQGDDASVFAQLNADLTTEDASAVRNALAGESIQLLDVVEITSGSNQASVDSVMVKSQSADGDADVGTVSSNDGMALFKADLSALSHSGRTGTGGGTMMPDDSMTQDPDDDDMMSDGSMTDTSSSSSGGAVLGIGLLAVLMSTFMADEDASASFGDYYFNTPQSAYIAKANERGVLTIKETGNQPYQMWIRTGQTAQPMRMTGVSNSGVSGTEVGINLYNSDTFYINTSVAPNVSAEVGSLNLAAKGEVYSLSSGWRNDRYFAGLRLSHGDFEVNSIVDNPIVNSALISNAKLRNTQAQLRAGMNLSTGDLRFTPSASIQVGTYENSEHVAESPALEATIPSYTQDYTSVQLGLKMTSEKWLSFTNGSKWKPQLKFDSIHTDSSDTGSLTLRQSDKAGALSFNTNAGLRSMPDVVNSMSFGAKVKSSTNDQAEWKFGFAGLEADGEEYYAAMAAYQLKF